MRNWWIGCSGFSYKHWKGRFYPEGVPAKRWFEYYCEHFNTVELNVTFFRIPRPPLLKSWYERSPKEFRFTLKAPRWITHYRRFKNITTQVDNFYNAIGDGLRDKLGTILFQLHPEFEYSEENLELLVKHLDPSFSNVIEFRHESWWQEDVYKTLKKSNITFCGISYPGLAEDVVRTSPVMYYRFHGVPKLYLSPYNTEELKAVTDQIKATRSVQDIYIYFNNDIDVHAIYNAKTVQSLVSRSRAGSTVVHS